MRYKESKLLWTIFALATAAIVLLVAVGYIIVRSSARRPAIELPTTQIAVPVQAELDPIRIEAIRSRGYQASQIQVEQNLGSSEGYNNQVVSYTSDGLKQYAQMFTPLGNAPIGGWPVIVLNHGYVNPSEYQTTNSPTYQNLMAQLARAGFVVIKPDYRGHASSQGTPEGGHFSPVYTYDVLNLVASLQQYSLVNPNRIGMIGHSLGGHVSLRAAVSSPAIKATAYLSGVVGSISDILYNWPNSPMPSDLPSVVQSKREELLNKYGDPKSNPNFWDSASAINYVKYITGVSLVYTSTNDGVVPPSFSQRLTDALRQASKPVDFFTTPGNDHLFAQNQAAVVSHIVEFFKGNL